MDPIELRKYNYAAVDPENKKPYSSKFLWEAYDLGAQRFGWDKRHPNPRSMQEDGWLIGYGMSTGLFGAFRGAAKVSVRFAGDGILIIRSAVADSGPGTATAMVKIASELMSLPTNRVKFELGDSDFPPGPTQGGSSTTATLGTAVSAACQTLKQRLFEAAKSTGMLDAYATIDSFDFADGEIRMKNSEYKVDYARPLKVNNTVIEFTEETSRNPEMQKYSAYSYSVHFVRVKVHPLTGVVKIDKVLTAADAGKIVSEKQAQSQMIGGVVGGIGMALMEEGVIDHRYGRWVNNNFADYHVPVHADAPHVEVVFVNKPDPVLNPMGSKGMGEIALIGFAAAVANAVYHATGKRIRELPITPDKVLL